jgi:hypothetical protein
LAWLSSIAIHTLGIDHPRFDPCRTRTAGNAGPTMRTGGETRSETQPGPATKALQQIHPAGTENSLSGIRSPPDVGPWLPAEE